MSDQPPPDVLGGLPRRRPQRRSDKRASPATPGGVPATPRARTAPPKPPSRTAAAGRKQAPEKREPAPPGRKRAPAKREPAPPERKPEHILGTAAQAAAELAEIGFAVGVRALRDAVARLPRP
ncbi:MAG: hypothetical protein JO262_19515 [Solirubrobacterales bacterium]|nr:hypothetical protein [Solirubrobacterales bacterium]